MNMVKMTVTLRIFAWFTYVAAILSLILAVISPYLALAIGQPITIVLMIAPSSICLIGVSLGLWAHYRQFRSTDAIVFRVALPWLLTGGIALFSCIFAAIYLPGRSQLLLESRAIRSRTLAVYHIRSVMRAAQSYAIDRGAWPNDLIMLFDSKYLRADELPPERQTDVARLLESTQRSPDAEDALRTALHIDYFGSGVSTQSDNRVIIMHDRDSTPSGDTVVGFANGEIRALTVDQLRDAGMLDKQARLEAH